MLGDLDVLLLRGHPGGFRQGLFQPGRRLEILYLAAHDTGEVVMVPRQVLCQLETPMVVGSSHAPHDSDLHEGSHIAVGARLGHIRAQGDELGNRERPGRRREGLDQDSARRGVALVAAPEAGADFPVQGGELPAGDGGGAPGCVLVRHADMVVGMLDQPIRTEQRQII